MKNFICSAIFFFCILIDFSALAQKDSLLRALKTCQSKDSSEILNDLSQIYRFNEQDSAMMFATLGLEAAIRSGNVMEQANAENGIGVQNHLKARYSDAMGHYLKSLKLFESINFIKGVASASQNIGIVYADQGKLPMANKYYLQAAELYKKAGHKKGLAACYNNIAVIYSLSNNISKALEYHFLALKMREELQDSMGIASSYGGLAVQYAALKDYKKAIEYNAKEIEISTRLGNERDLATTYNNIGDSYYNFGNLTKAKEYFLKGIELAKSNEDYFALNDLYFNLAALYEKTGAYKEAVAIQKDFIDTRDSLFKIQSMDKVIEMESQYQNEKKELLLQKQSVEIDAKQKENEAKNRLLLYSSIGLIIIAVFAFFAFKNFLTVRKANVVIQQQKQNLEIKNVEISQQKELVEHKQKEIIDSINYARRIQQAVLTGEEVWNKVSKEHFILFKPKDIVSGDFYWAYNTPNGRSVFALADCTGHGVPGGFMSMLGNSFLNEIVVDNKIFKASEILNKLREKIIGALEQKGHSEQKDGMDISLCVWNKMDNTLEFAGANNPLWILSGNELMEYKANKMPIGTYVGETAPFTSHQIQLKKNDLIYLITDGFADQFGGPKGKKFKYKPLQELLVAYQQESMLIQKEQLAKAINEWKLDYEQVDDISLIGIKV